MPAPTCPNRETLLQYSIGMLSNEQSEQLAGHLESCPDCQATIVTLEDAEDTLIGRLRTPLTSESCLAEPQFQTALAEVIAGKGDRPETGTGPLIKGPVPVSLGEYQILEELGRGGMGRVFKALQTKLDRVVAIKVLPWAKGTGPFSRGPVPLEDRRAITRFEREMKAVGRLAHPNIVQAYDAREIDSNPVLIMEFVDGLDLAEIVHRLGPLGVADSCELIRRVALALQCAHEHGLVHRDIKPSNIMLTRLGEVKLLDLGLARFYADALGTGSERSSVPVPFGSELTNSGQAMGTADYMAPEQASDSRTVDIRADIYSLGCTFYKLLSGQAPFGGPEYHATLDKLNAHVQKTPPPIRQLVADIPQEVSAILDHMLAKDPADRFPTPADVAKAIEPFCAGANLVDIITRAISIDPLSLRERARVRAAKFANIQIESKNAPLSAPSHHRSIPILVAVAVAFMAAGFVLGIIIKINKDGKETTLDVPPGSAVRVGEDGNAGVSPPSQAKPNVEPAAPDEKAKPAGLSVTFHTAKVTRGDIVATVRASGTIEPEEMVDVAAQVSGQIVGLGDDPRGASDPAFKGKSIDYNSPVEEGTILARIDNTVYKLKVEQEKAAVRRAEAELTLAKSKYESAKRIENTISENDLLAAKLAVDAAEAALEQAKAAMDQAQINLDRTIIKSPVKGVIIIQRVNIGQNVGPDTKAQSLFLIAKDLKKMQILASVNEADIAQIHEGTPVTFTVDAFPKQKFTGKETQIRHAAVNHNYAVIVAFDNSDLKLLPYLKAWVKFEVDVHRDVLYVSNDALHWMPYLGMMANLRDQEASIETTNMNVGPGNRKILWSAEPDGWHVLGHEIQTGITDGTLTEISGPDVKEGMEVVVGQISQRPDARATGNPFKQESREPAQR